MIGNFFPNGWKIHPVFPTIGKIFRQFSNDWKKFSRPSLANKTTNRTKADKLA
jgi:hypothetical protein